MMGPGQVLRVPSGKERFAGNSNQTRVRVFGKFTTIDPLPAFIYEAITRTR